MSDHVIRMLERLLIGDVPLEGQGICSNLPRCDRWSVWQELTRWPGFSGHSLYPIPYRNIDPAAAYNALPLWTGEYGDTRKRAVAWLIERRKAILQGAVNAAD